MKSLKSLILGFVAVATFVVVGIALPATAFAMCVTDDDCPSCQECTASNTCAPCLCDANTGACMDTCNGDGDCPFGQVCGDFGFCEAPPNVCETTGTNNYRTVAIFPSAYPHAVGDAITIGGNPNQASSGSCANDSTCQKNYYSKANPNVSDCNSNMECAYVQPSKTSGNTSANMYFEHQHTVTSGKWKVVEVVGYCSSNNDQIVIIEDCQC